MHCGNCQRCVPKKARHRGSSRGQVASYVAIYIGISYTVEGGVGQTQSPWKESSRKVVRNLGRGARVGYSDT